jgi:hypothetical protein
MAEVEEIMIRIGRGLESVAGWTLALAVSLPAAGAETCAAPGALVDLVLSAIDEQKGVTFWIGGQRIPVLVSSLNANCEVEGRNREYDRIVVRLDRVDAAARN